MLVEFCVRCLRSCDVIVHPRAPFIESRRRRVQSFGSAGRNIHHRKTIVLQKLCKMLVILLIVAAVLNTSKAKLLITVENNNKAQVTAVTQGSDVILNCSSTVRDNTSEIVWFKNDNLIEHEVKASPAILVFHNASKEGSNGNYKCLNKRNNETSSYSLRVDEPPIIELSDTEVDFYTSDQKTVTCKAEGWPTPAVHWKTPSGVIVYSSILKLDDDNIQNHTGHNTCYARNRAGTAEERCFVAIKPNPTSLSKVRPMITSKQNRTVVGYRGENVSFAVKTRNTPIITLSYEWSFGGQKLLPGIKYKMSYTYNEKNHAELKMTVKNLSSSDAGVYKLIVQTHVPPQAEDYIKLEVRERDVATNKTDALYGKIEYAKMWIPVVVSSCVAFVFVILLGNFLVKRKKYVFFKGLKKEAPKFDAFISYSTSDFDWVSEHLIPLLAKHHVRYSIHSKDFEIGKTIVDNMADSVYMCKHVVAVLSDRYLESAFCQTELDMAICRSSIDKKPVLTIINLNCDLTKKYSKLSKQNVYFQSVRKDDDRWKEELMHHLKSYVSETV